MYFFLNIFVCKNFFIKEKIKRLEILLITSFIILLGTLFYNYNSIVLLAIYDAKYNFILFDRDQYNTNKNCGVLSKSTFRKLL